MSAGWDDAHPLTRSFQSESGNTSSFPIPSAAQFASIDKVITALPPNTDSWLPLDDTCHRLNIDESYLPLFLKLGLERGANWRDKWDNAQAGLRQRGVLLGAAPGRERVEPSEESSLVGGQQARGKAGGFELLKAAVDNVKTPRRATTTTTSQTQPLDARSAPTRASSLPKSTKDASNAARAKVAPHPPPRDFLVAPRADYVSSSDDYAGVPSFKRVTAKPAYPLQSTPAPAPRASTSATPLVDSAISSARAATNKRSSFPPPATQTDSPALKQYIQSHSKPRPQAVTFQQQPAADDGSRTGSIQSVRLTTALESRADDFRRLSLLSSAWFSWQTHLHTIHTRQDHLDQARRAVLLRWAFTKWRAKRAQLDELNEREWQVQAAREEGLVRNAMVLWVGAVERKRRREWEAGLRAAWDAVRAKWKEKVARECFDHWRALALETKAMRFRRDLLLLHAFRQWRARGATVHKLNADADALNRHTTQRRALLQWHHTSTLNQIERDYTHKRDLNVLWSCLDQWSRRLRQSREEARLEQIADEHSVRNRSLATLSTWRLRLQRVRQLDQTCEELQDRFDQRTTARHFNRWVTEWTGKLLLNSRALQLQQRTLRHWRERFEHISVDLEARHIAFTSHVDRKLLKGALDKWDAVKLRHREEADLADELARQASLQRSLVGWRKRLENEEVKEEQAEVARRFFGQRRGWNAWVGAVAARKQARWIEARKCKQQREVLAIWLARLRQHRAEEVIVNEFKQAVDARLIVSAVERWTGVIVARREAEDLAQKGYETRLVESVFGQWTDVCAKHAEDYRLVDSFKDVKADELKRRVFRHWLKATRTAVDLDSRLKQFTAQRELALLSDCWDVLREKALATQEAELRQMRMERIVFESWERWKRATKSLPAIRFANEHLKQRVWRAWSKQVTDPGMRQEAEEFDEKRVLRPVLREWRTRTKEKLAKRSIRRFRSTQQNAPQPISASPRSAYFDSTPSISTPGLSTSISSVASSTSPMIAPAPVRAYFRPSTAARASPSPTTPPPASLATANGDVQTGAMVRSRLSAEYYRARESGAGRQSPKPAVAVLERGEEDEEDGPSGAVNAVEEKRANLREAMRARLGR